MTFLITLTVIHVCFCLQAALLSARNLVVVNCPNGDGEARGGKTDDKETDSMGCTKLSLNGRLWWIQEFPESGGTNSKVGGANLLFMPLFPKFPQKLDQRGRGGGWFSSAPLDPPLDGSKFEARFSPF